MREVFVLRASLFQNSHFSLQTCIIFFGKIPHLVFSSKSLFQFLCGIYSFFMKSGLLFCNDGEFDADFVRSTVVVGKGVVDIESYNWYVVRESSVELEDDPRSLCMCVMRVCWLRERVRGCGGVGASTWV